MGTATSLMDMAGLNPRTILWTRGHMFLKQMFEKIPNSSAAEKQLGFMFVRRRDEPHNMERILTTSLKSVKRTAIRVFTEEEHKEVILEYVDENPSVVLEQLMVRLLQKFGGLKISKSTLYEFVRTRCNLTLKKPGSNLWTGRARPSTKSALTGLRPPQPPAKKRKRGSHAELTSTGTVADYYLSFLKATMDEMDKYVRVEGHYFMIKVATESYSDAALKVSRCLYISREIMGRNKIICRFKLILDTMIFSEMRARVI
ncbi:hypothetical protein VTP01DRAFT_2340 [Rhizomucor pusillus]|uniref:uncharacterized protein n=1 Tax=Rhizomucor pusillus TaxID=4840 RepID=UPI0037421F22